MSTEPATETTCIHRQRIAIKHAHGADRITTVSVYEGSRRVDGKDFSVFTVVIAQYNSGDPEAADTEALAPTNDRLAAIATAEKLLQMFQRVL